MKIRPPSHCEHIKNALKDREHRNANNSKNIQNKWPKRNV